MAPSGLSKDHEARARTHPSAVAYSPDDRATALAACGHALLSINETLRGIHEELNIMREKMR